ncbi:hypothetical protein [Streptomyces sp. NPDC004296]|uniref:hypothetical protein n=1 Tax=Streptomyces sp. NPDC004296 TaxID=3364697 RepID=UPI003676CDEF
MIRIVSRAHLAALEQVIKSAHAHIEEVQDTAAEAASCHTRSVQRLSTALAAARAAADGHQADAGIARELLEHAEGQLADTQATVAAQAEQIKALQADLAAMAGAVVLLRYGQLDSVHPDEATAQDYARSLGCPAVGWGPASGPASEVPWRVSSLSRFVVQHEVADGGAR